MPFPLRRPAIPHALRKRFPSPAYPPPQAPARFRKSLQTQDKAAVFPFAPRRTDASAGVAAMERIRKA